MEVLTCALRASSSTSSDCLWPLPAELPCLLRGLGLLSQYSAAARLLGLASLRLAEGSGLAVRRCLMGELVLRLLLVGVHMGRNGWVGSSAGFANVCRICIWQWLYVHDCTAQAYTDEKVQVSGVHTG